MKRMLHLLTTAVGVLLLGAAAAGAEQSYSDPAGDAGAGPDVTAAAVSNDPGGTITMKVTISLGPETAMVAVLDTNVNGSSSDASDRAIIAVGVAPGVVTAIAMDGEGNAVAAPSLRASATSSTLELVFAKADLGIDKAFGFWLATMGGGAADFADEAPDTGAWMYILSVPPPPVVKPVIGKPVTTPLAPKAGTRFTVTFPVRRSDNGAPLLTGRMVCDPSVSGRVLRHAESFTGGKARLSFQVPKTAKGKLLTVKVKIATGAQSSVRVATFRVR
jgi:hypothetical protein